MALTSFTIFGRAWGRVNPLTSSQDAVVARQRASNLSRTFPVRLNILYVSARTPTRPTLLVPRRMLYLPGVRAAEEFVSTTPTVR